MARLHPSARGTILAIILLPFLGMAAPARADSALNDDSALNNNDVLNKMCQSLLIVIF